MNEHGVSDRHAMPDDLHPRHLGRRLAQLALLGVVVAALVTTLPGLGDLRGRFAHADPLWIVASGVLELGSCLAYVVAFRGVFCPQMSWRFSYEVGMAEQATNVLLPTGGAGGLALGAWALRQDGVPTAHIARRSVAFFVITSAPNFLCAALVGALLAVHLLPGHAPAATTATLAVLAALAIVGVLALPRALDRRRSAEPPEGRLRSWLHKASGALSEGVRDAVALLRSRDPMIAGGSLAYLALDIVSLAAAFTAFGGAPSVGPLVFAYVVGQLGGLIPLPGGIGGTDGGLVGALVLYGTSFSQAAAAVLAYRAFQLGLPAILGAVAFVQLRRRLSGHPEPAELCRPLAEPVAAPSGTMQARA